MLTITIGIIQTMILKALRCLGFYGKNYPMGMFDLKESKMIYQLNPKQEDKTMSVLYLVKIANHNGNAKTGKPEFSQFVYANDGYSFQEFKLLYKERFGLDLTVPWEDTMPVGNYYPCMTTAEPIEMI